MSLKDIPAHELIDRVAEGWTPTHYGLAEELLHRIKGKLVATVEISKVGEGSLHFTAELTDIRLRGIDNVPCLLLTGDNSTAIEACKQFMRMAAGPGKIPFLLTLSQPAHQAVLKAQPWIPSLVLSRGQIKELLETSDGLSFLKCCLRQQIHRRRLIPYTFLLPVEGPMFFGRSKDLARLIDEEDVSFAIAGPGKIGKSSLLKEYQRQLKRLRDPRIHRLFYIDCYDFDKTSDDAVARHIALRIESSKRSSEMTAAGLVQFLRIKCSRVGGPLELLLDEVDEVCTGTAFRMLGKAARAGLCRLVLAGRGSLFKMMLSQDEPLSCRVDLIRPEPLDEVSARRLILEPLQDLGFLIESPDHVVDLITRLTGNLPHLIQFYGKKLADLAVDQGMERLGLEHVDLLKWDFEIAGYFISPLQGLSDTESRAVAEVLLRDGRKEFDLPRIQEMAKEHAIQADVARIADICNDLVVNNILAWNAGSFRIANEALPYYAREMGFWDQASRPAAHA